MILEKFKKYLIKTQNTSPYPPYHQGMYLEEYFFNFFIKNEEKFKNIKYQYLPVFWTDIYLNAPHLIDQLQRDLNDLDKEKFYFSVSQHDDAPFQLLPPNTIKFSAGGNIPNCVPIPLICSKIPELPEVQDKDIFCSFIGSITSPISKFGIISYNLRIQMLESLVNKKEYVLKPKNWGPEIKKERQDMFLNLTAKSKFTLCPRGYGATSFRLYEAMQLKSVPVYIYYEKPYLPFSSKLNWDDIAVLIDSNDINTIDDRLKAITPEKYDQMIEYTQKIYPKYFTLDGMCDKILETLQEI